VDEVDFNEYHGNPGDEIIVLAHNDLRVVKVRVAIFSANNKEVEGGAREY
jgi:hypothetical protein